MNKKVKRIVSHHSAIEWGTALEIDRWHKESPFNWSGIGYHYVILNGYTNYEDYKNSRILKPVIGSIEIGRRMDLDDWVEQNEIGAHVLGYNEDSIGICLIHDTDQEYDDKMIRSFFYLVKFLILHYEIDIEDVVGHYELDDKKPECPGIDMNLFRGMLCKKTWWHWMDMFGNSFKF